MAAVSNPVKTKRMCGWMTFASADVLAGSIDFKSSNPDSTISDP